MDKTFYEELIKSLEDFRKRFHQHGDEIKRLPAEEKRLWDRVLQSNEKLLEHKRMHEEKIEKHKAQKRAKRPKN